jgi:hypothetical protein
MVLLWPACGFTAAVSAAEAFRRAYPHAPDDEHLPNFIAERAAEAREV